MKFKKGIIYLGGVVTGVILTMLTLLSLTHCNSVDDRITFFEEEGQCISNGPFKIIQVLSTGDALANEIKTEYHVTIPTGLTVLFPANNQSEYYDNQIIRVPSGKCAKQIGIFKYTSAGGLERTVPVVEIL